MNKQDWTYKKLGEVCETSSGGTPSKSHKEYYEGGEIPWLRSGEVAQGLIYNTELFITDLGLEKSSAKIFPVETVVIAMYGATVGQVGLLKKEMATNQAICGILPNNNLFPLFLLYTLKSKKSLFLKDAVGGAQPNISQNLIKNTIIPIPPIAEQERIVAELDLLSGIIEKKKEQLKAYDQLAQSIFYTMFGDPIDNPKGWETKKLGDVCIIERGGSPRPIEKYLTEDESGINWIKIGDATEGGMVISSTKQKIIHEGLKNSRFVHKGDFLLSNSMSFGKPYILGVDGCIHDGWLVIQDVNNTFNKIYLYYFLGSPQTYESFRTMAVGGVVNNLNKNVVKSLKVAIPDAMLQQEFAEKVEAIERQKALVQQSIEETQTMFDCTMDKYFG